MDPLYNKEMAGQANGFIPFRDINGNIVTSD